MATKQEQTIVVKSSQGDQKVTALVLGRLAVHKTVMFDGTWNDDGFTITEISSGRAVIVAYFARTFAEVRKTAENLLPLFADCPYPCDMDSPEFHEWSGRVASTVRQYRKDLR